MFIYHPRKTRGSRKPRGTGGVKDLSTTSTRNKRSKQSPKLLDNNPTGPATQAIIGAVSAPPDLEAQLELELASRANLANLLTEHQTFLPQSLIPQTLIQGHPYRAPPAYQQYPRAPEIHLHFHNASRESPPPNMALYQSTPALLSSPSAPDLQLSSSPRPRRQRGQKTLPSSKPSKPSKSSKPSKPSKPTKPSSKSKQHPKTSTQSPPPLPGRHPAPAPAPAPALAPPHPPLRSKPSQALLSAAGNALGSMTRLDLALPPPNQGQASGFQSSCPLTNAAVDGGLRGVDLIASKLDAIIERMDCRGFGGREAELCVLLDGLRGGCSVREGEEVVRAAEREGRVEGRDGKDGKGRKAGMGTGVFAKSWGYANARLDAALPLFTAPLNIYPLLCLSARLSYSAYTPARTPSTKETHIPQSRRTGAKAMIIKTFPASSPYTSRWSTPSHAFSHSTPSLLSTPSSSPPVTIIAIRGSSSLTDWATNLSSTPVSPAGFLPDEGNLVHAGFLAAARAICGPIAVRLRELVERDPSILAGELVFTGHSAGAAVAGLAFAHVMWDANCEGEGGLRALVQAWRRVSCIGFGAPPVGLLPLGVDTSSGRRSRKSGNKGVWLAVINEGDPVPRADKAYIRALLDLYASPAPSTGSLAHSPAAAPLAKQKSPLKSKLSFPALLRRPKKVQPVPSQLPAGPDPGAPVWKVPPCMLSIAGRAVVLRARPGGIAVGGGELKIGKGGVDVKRAKGLGGLDDFTGASGAEDVIAQVVTDEQLRGVVWGDPVMHSMEVYRRRVEGLAKRAVVGDNDGW